MGIAGAYCLILLHVTSTEKKNSGQYQIMIGVDCETQNVIEEQISTTTTTLEPLENNLTPTNFLLFKQTTIEEELLECQQQVDELCTQAEKLKQLEQKKSGEIDFPLSFSSAIQSNTFEQLHLNAYFDLHLHKFMIFGPCPHTKIYNFDDTIFISYAIIIVFLPSNYIGGNYRFINQNLEPIYPTNSTNIFLFGKNLNKMPTKLIIPFQHSLDDSPYFSYLFHDKYRITFELIKPAMKYFPSFLIYSAIFFK
ncbi:unnamed protein product [Rotaria sordida]|uniref:Uncharacterized protein n=1 Tax=Rotaria sordida TaxID=392033 RepID=A0A815B5U8_9BILA|nr:unnamed protein product [Rotaria sordida]CAF4194554.1 unnamed protein product [Rotaria sordida]